jgi:chromosome segregation ATPase
MDTISINLIMNVLGVIFGGGAFVGLLTFMWRMRGLRNADMADIRDHYAEELTALRAKLNSQEDHFRSMEKHWREMLNASDKRHEECETARQELRLELNTLHDEIRGLREQLLRYSADKVLFLGASEIVTDAAHRVKDITDKGK